MRRSFPHALYAAALCLLLALGHAAQARAHGVTLELHHPLPAESTFQTAFLVPWAEKVAKESGGRLHFRLHPGSPDAGDGSGLYEKVRQGDIDAAWTAIRPAADRFPALGIFEAPFVVRTAEGASRGLMEYVRVNDLADRDFDGVRLLALHLGDGRQLHWRQGVDAAPTALTGRRVGVETASDAAAMTALGASATELDPAGMIEALRRGSIDGVLLSWTRAAAAGVDRATATHTEVGPDAAGITHPLFALVLSPDSYRGLADDLKAVIQANSGPETAAWMARVMNEAAAAARESATARGDATVAILRDVRERWAEATAALRERSATPPLRASAREQLGKADPLR